MDSRRPWFDQEALNGKYDCGSVITTENGAQWKVLERLKQDHFQADRKSGTTTVSYASLKLRCVRILGDQHSTFESLMRVYMQIPRLGTENEDPVSRKAQANMKFRPAELDAYIDLSRDSTVTKFIPKLLGERLLAQDASGFVPGGFIVIFVFEKVPGLPLRDKMGNTSAFWTSPRRDRSKIRIAFEETFK